MDISPFRYQGPLAPEEVHGRDDLLGELTERVTGRRVTALLGPRRFGKTSVLRRLAADLSEVSTISVDLFGVQTHSDLVLRLEAGLAAADRPVRHPAYQLSAAAGFKLGGLHAQLQLSPKQRPDASVLAVQLMRIIVEVSATAPTLLIFDEFQSVTEVKGATAALRTELQHHYDRLGLLFAGSAPSAMRNVFTRHDQPFFNQADLLPIGPLSLSAVHQIVTQGFESTGKDAGGVAAQIFPFTSGHPQRTMRLADAAWRMTGPGQPADAHWGAALEDVQQAESATLAATYGELTGDERKVLRLFGHGEPLLGAASKRLELSAGGARHAHARLLADGTLYEHQGATAVTDPLLADWVRANVPL